MSPLREELGRLPALLSAHLLLVIIAMAIGMMICIPLSMIALRSRRARPFIMGATSIVQTVPSLALLALMVAAFGLFDRAAAIPALAAYSLLPILRNTVTGIEDVDRNVIEAARGIGMTRRQILLGVQIPLAAPVIVAGLRTATVWIVGIATLSTPVGADSLGNYIFSGLQTRNTTSVMVGVVSAALLALTLDGLIRAGEIAARRRSKRLAIAVIASLAVIIGLAILPSVARVRAPASERIVIGAKTFTEQFVLARHIEQTLNDAGVTTVLKEGLGSTVVFDALTRGEIDLYVDYSGTIWANHMKRAEPPLRHEMIPEIAEWLDATHGVRCTGSLGFENTYALAMRRERAEALAIRSIADLLTHAPDMTIAGDYEFFARPEWKSIVSAYGLSFDAEKPMDATLMYEAARGDAVDVIVAFSTDGRIAAYNLVVLEDPRGAIPPYDAILLLSRRAASTPGVERALQRLVGSIDNAAMRRANMIVDVEGGSINAAAQSLR